MAAGGNLAVPVTRGKVVPESTAAVTAALMYPPRFMPLSAARRSRTARTSTHRVELMEDLPRPGPFPVRSAFLVMSVGKGSGFDFLHLFGVCFVGFEYVQRGFPVGYRLPPVNGEVVGCFGGHQDFSFPAGVFNPQGGSSAVFGICSLVQRITGRWLTGDKGYCRQGCDYVGCRAGHGIRWMILGSSWSMRQRSGRACSGSGFQRRGGIQFQSVDILG